jgi:hypothetical protein
MPSLLVLRYACCTAVCARSMANAALCLGVHVFASTFAHSKWMLVLLVAFALFGVRVDAAGGQVGYDSQTVTATEGEGE